MTDKEITERAKEAEKRTSFGELVHSPLSRGVNSAYGIGFIEGMVEYRNSLQEKHVSEDLEEVSDKYGKNIESNYSNDMFDRGDIMKAFEDGAQWQREQMMVEAVEGGCFSYKNGYVHISCDIDEHLTNIKFGDKIKVIVIKEN